MTSHKGKGNRRLRVCGAVANNSSLITSLGIGWRGWGNVFRFRDYAIDFARARHSPTPFYNSPLLPRDVTLMSKKYPWIGYFLVIYIKIHIEKSDEQGSFYPSRLTNDTNF